MSQSVPSNNAANLCLPVAVGVNVCAPSFHLKESCVCIVKEVGHVNTAATLDALNVKLNANALSALARTIVLGPAKEALPTKILSFLSSKSNVIVPPDVSTVTDSKCDAPTPETTRGVVKVSYMTKTDGYDVPSAPVKTVFPVMVTPEPGMNVTAPAP